MGVIFWLAVDSGQNLAVPMAHLLDRLLRRPSVKDEGLARYIDDVMAKPQLVFRVELSSYVAPAPAWLAGARQVIAKMVDSRR